jgi:hypothetical protein
MSPPASRAVLAIEEHVGHGMASDGLGDDVRVIKAAV